MALYADRSDYVRALRGDALDWVVAADRAVAFDFGSARAAHDALVDVRVDFPNARVFARAIDFNHIPGATRWEISTDGAAAFWLTDRPLARVA